MIPKPFRIVLVGYCQEQFVKLSINLMRLRFKCDDIFSVKDGQEALTKLRHPKNKIALVITDLKVTGFSSYRLVETIYDDSGLSHLRVILTTSIDQKKEFMFLSRSLEQYENKVYPLRENEVSHRNLGKAIVKLFDR